MGVELKKLMSDGWSYPVIGNGGDTDGDGKVDPFKHLVTDANGNKVWEEQTHYFQEEVVHGEITVGKQQDSNIEIISDGAIGYYDGNTSVHHADAYFILSVDDQYVRLEIDEVGPRTYHEVNGLRVAIRLERVTNAGYTALITYTKGKTGVNRVIGLSYIYPAAVMLDERFLPNGNVVNGRYNGSIRTSVAEKEDEEYTMGRGASSFGIITKASGSGSFAEGQSTIASGNCSHAEGFCTTSSGASSHSEGRYTVAASSGQHVQGKYNVEDAEDTYAHIVGNGTSGTARSNAHTLDWSGNAWYAGTVEGTAMIIKSPNGTRYQITVSDDGTLTATAVTN